MVPFDWSPIQASTGLPTRRDRIPIAQTDDGQPKSWFVTDGSRIYFEEGLRGSRKIVQVSVTGGSVSPVETGLPDAWVVQVARDGSGLLVHAPNSLFSLYDEGSLWWIPLPAGEPRRLGSFDVSAADMLPDGRIVFGKFTPGKDPKGTDSRAQWFIAEKDGSNPRALVSFPGSAGGVWATPDGRVLLSQVLAGDRRLFEIGADGRGLRELKKAKDTEGDGIWMPDKKYLVYQSGIAPPSDIWLLPMRTGFFRHPGKPIRLTNGPIPYSYPLPSPDGKQIFVLGTKERGELVRYDMQSHEFKPFLSGISATVPTFSRDGKWVVYTTYPDRILWRSRSDGTERRQLTSPSTQVFAPSISPDGTKVAFSTDKFELFVIGMEGGQPQKIDEKGTFPSWSPDGNYLYYQIGVPYGGGGVIADLRTGTKSLVPSSEHKFGFWLTQDALITVNVVEKFKFQIFDLNTRKWTDFAQGRLGDNVVYFRLSLDGRYLYFTTEGTDPKVSRLRFSDQQVETITSLKDLNRVIVDADELSVAPEGSPIFTGDTGYQEIYALNIRWP